MELLPLTLASGWASGVNAYATVLLLGLFGRFAHIDSIPSGLERTDVLVIAAVYYPLPAAIIACVLPASAVPQVPAGHADP